MKSYLADAGLSVLQYALTVLTEPPSVRLTGVQVGSQAGFVPDAGMVQAQGTMLVDRRQDPTSVKVTKIYTHEAIITAILDRDVEFMNVGNVLFFMNDAPTLWLISDTAFPKLGTNPVSHFAGDKCYLPIVFRFPYIEKLLVQDASNALQAKWPHFDKTTALTVPQQTLADQCVVEQNNLFYGQDQPYIAVRCQGSWRALPFMRQVQPDFFQVDGGNTVTGI
jgi:hypothetical protein